MKVLVLVKKVVDHKTRIRVRSDGTGIDTANVKMSINPFDEVALEEAVRLRESGWAREVVAVSVGAAVDTLRTALTLGANRALHIPWTQERNPLLVARLLREVTERERPDLVLCGKQGIDTDARQTGPMLAALNGWPQATCAVRLQPLDGRVVVMRELDRGCHFQKSTARNFRSRMHDGLPWGARTRRANRPRSTHC